MAIPTTPYPSIPVPGKDIESMHSTLMLMRHTLQLLIVNSQQSTGQTLTESAQVFNRVGVFSNVPQAVLQQPKKL
jgi:hypothetical protein